MDPLLVQGTLKYCAKVPGYKFQFLPDKLFSNVLEQVSPSPPLPPRKEDASSHGIFKDSQGIF